MTRLRGRFAFVQIADPHGHIWEPNKKDNLSEVYMVLSVGADPRYRTGALAP